MPNLPQIRRAAAPKKNSSSGKHTKTSSSKKEKKTKSSSTKKAASAANKDEGVIGRLSPQKLRRAAAEQQQQEAEQREQPIGGRRDFASSRDQPSPARRRSSSSRGRAGETATSSPKRSKSRNSRPQEVSATQKKTKSLTKKKSPSPVRQQSQSQPPQQSKVASKKKTGVATKKSSNHNNNKTPIPAISTSSSNFSRSQLIENPQLASSSQSTSTSYTEEQRRERRRPSSSGRAQHQSRDQPPPPPASPSLDVWSPQNLTRRNRPLWGSHDDDYTPLEEYNDDDYRHGSTPRHKKQHRSSSSNPVTRLLPPESPVSKEKRHSKDATNNNNNKGFFNNLFGGVVKGIRKEDKVALSRRGKKSTKALAAEMLEVGSDATLTAGDFLVEEEEEDGSFFTTDDSPISPTNNESRRPMSKQQQQQQQQQNAKKNAPQAFFPDNAKATTTTTEQAGATKKKKQASKTKSPKNSSRKKLLSNELFEADSGSSSDDDDDEEDASAVSNLTDPTIFYQKNAQHLLLPAEASSPRREFKKEEGKKVSDTAPPMPPSTNHHSKPLQPKQQPSPTSSSSRGKALQEPQSLSWGEASSANYTQTNPALGRALDMKLTENNSDGDWIPINHSQESSPSTIATGPAEAITPATPAAEAAKNSKATKKTAAATAAASLVAKSKSPPPPASFMQSTSASRSCRVGKSGSTSSSPLAAAAAVESKVVAQKPQPLSPSVRQKKALQRQQQQQQQQEQSMPPARALSPLRQSSGGMSYKKKEAATTSEWSKLKDNMIEQRVANSKKDTTSTTEKLTKTRNMDKAAAMRRQLRSLSATPASKQAATRQDTTTAVRSQSATRATRRHVSPFRRDMKRRYRFRTTTTTIATTTNNNNNSTTNSVQRLEPLTKVMSSVPSSLASRGPSDSIEMKRMESEISLANSPRANDVKHHQHGTTSRTRAAAGNMRRNPSPARDARTRHDSPPKGSHGLVQGSSILNESAAPLFASPMSKLRAQSKPPQHQPPRQTARPTFPMIPGSHSYVPKNAYAGRFTPVKKKDKISEIMAIKEQETKEDNSVSSSIISRKKHANREAGAKKLKNMIKLKNHFAPDSASAASSSILPSASHNWKLNRSTFSYRSNEEAFREDTAAYESSILPALFRRQPLVTEKKADKMTMLRERGLIDSFSVAGYSDLHSIRSSLQSRHENDYLARYYSRLDIDPLHMDELRLSGSAVVPIQAATRRFLARREALSRLWGVLVIQARVRSFLEQIKYETKIYAVTRIQAAARGMLARDRLMFEDYCATEIQRHFRGYFAAVQAYDTVYKISLVQSLVRMRQAMNKATIRMYCVVKLQGLARGFVTRIRLKNANRNATTVQRYVRSYLSTMKVYEEVYKITIVQNCIRRRQAMKSAATRMSLALSLQALARGHLVRGRLELAQYHATTIQRYTRGYLATMRVFEEVYKIILIQNFVRMKGAINKATLRMTMIIKVQANWRRYCVMRRMEYAHYNAIEIQKYIRGYLTTMAVYEELYKITLIQNIVRMRKAKALAQRRKRLVLQTQAIVRGFILRGRLSKIRYKAVTIQTAWRSFYYRMIYQFRLLDIIIVQSVWRRRRACTVVSQKRQTLHSNAATIIQSRWRCYDAHMTYLQFQVENKSATIIQAQWRCYDTSMDYLHYLADVLIVQSMVRRWFALRRVTGILEEKSIVVQKIARGFLGRLFVKKTKAVTEIQKTWRGFVTFADYMFTIADIVIVQTIVRRRIAVNKANYLRHKIEHDAAEVLQKWRRKEIYRRERSAVVLQKTWRRLVQEADFAIALHEYRAARTMQAYWRRFWKFSNYLICLDCSIRLQTVVRGFLARCQFADKQWGAVILQAAARRVVAKRRVISRKMVQAQSGTSSAIGALQSMAATVIQSALRGFQGRGAHVKYHAARTLQANFRGYRDRVLCQNHAAARLVQTEWRRVAAGILCIRIRAAIAIQKHLRGMIYSSAYTRFLAARCIQNAWRCTESRQLYCLHKVNFLAAAAIQAAFRGYFQYTNYLFALCDIVKAQSVVRMQLARQKLENLRREKFHQAASIQIQSQARRFLVRARHLSKHTTVIQRAWRRYFCSTMYHFMLSDIVRIQSYIRRQLAQSELRRRISSKQDHASMVIQKEWRGYFCRSNYAFIVTDIVKVQSQVRRYLTQKKFFDIWEDHAIKCAVTIQARWRSYFAEANYLYIVADTIKIQSVVRRMLARKEFLELFSEKCNKSVTALQTCWRRHRDERVYNATLFRVKLLQRTFRRYRILKETEKEAAILIQKSWRAFLGVMECFVRQMDIVNVQSLVRSRLAKKEYKRLTLERDGRAACKIQAAYRGWDAHSNYAVTKSAVLDIQRYWRGFEDRVGLFVAWKQHVTRINDAAIQFQRLWRGFVKSQRYLYQLGSIIEIQSLARMTIVQTRCKRQRTSATKIQCARRVVLAKRVMLKNLSKHILKESKQDVAKLSSAASRIQVQWRKVLNERRSNFKAVVIQSFMKQASEKRKNQKATASKKIAAFMVGVKSKLMTPEARNERKRKRAARVILKFLKMVKAEVDREIRNEIKRRQQKKEKRRRSQQMEDAILETAWQKTSKTGLDIYRSRRRGGLDTIGDGDKLLQETLDDLQSRSRCGMYASSNRGMPPSLSGMDSNKSINEDSSVNSGLTGATQLSQTSRRPTPSRVARLSPDEIDQDYFLEEAFLDAEIKGAKSRRQTEKRQKARTRQSRSSNASIGSQRTSNSRISVSTRESRDTRAPRVVITRRDSRDSTAGDSYSGSVSSANFTRDSVRHSLRK